MIYLYMGLQVDIEHPLKSGTLVKYRTRRKLKGWCQQNVNTQRKTEAGQVLT